MKIKNIIVGMVQWMYIIIELVWVFKIQIKKY